MEEVQAPGFCGRCGGCVSFCTAGEFHALQFDKTGYPEFADEDKCLRCGICYLVCPEIKALDGELRKQFNWKGPVGSYRALRSARTTKRKVQPLATDGGVVTSLLLYALDRHLIQAAIVSRRIGPFQRVPAVATTPEEVIDAAGAHYDDAAHLGEVGRRYTSFVPTIREISNLRQRALERVAIVGTPCQIYSLRKMQQLKVVPSDTITLTIGLFCMENFSLTPEARKKLEKKLHVKLSEIEKVNVKDDVIMTMKSGERLHVPFEFVDEVARPACFVCSDFANEFADISCGGLGSADGYTTVMVRTSLGEQVYNGARNKGYIREAKFRNKEEATLHRTTAMAKIFAFSQRKRDRAARTLERQ